MTTHRTLEHDPLAVGLTRPPLFMGVAIKIMFALFFLVAWVFAVTKSLWILPVGAVLYFVALFFSIKEPRFHEYLIRAITKTPPLRSRAQWANTNSYEPW